MSARHLARAALRASAVPRTLGVPAASARLLSTAAAWSTTHAAPPRSSSRASLAPAVLAATGLGATVAYAAAADDYSPTKEEIAAASSAIHELLDADDDLGPTLVRLAWHASGTYDKHSGTGGSDGATMRFQPESGHGANAGLEVARDALDPVKRLFPNISHADLWTVR